MIEVVRYIEQNKQRLRDENTEIASAALTVRYTATQAVVTTGTIVNWEAEVRSEGITWSGNTITITTEGFYVVSLPLRTSVVNTFFRCALTINGTNANSYTISTPAGTVQNIYYFSFMRYFNDADALQITVFPQVNCNIFAINEFGVESGILNISQLTGAIE